MGKTHKPKIKFLPWNALRLSASAIDSQMCPCPGMRLCLIRFFPWPFKLGQSFACDIKGKKVNKQIREISKFKHFSE